MASGASDRRTGGGDGWGVDRPSVGWAVAVCRGLGHVGRLGVLLAVREGAQAKGTLVELVGGSRAAVYRHVQAVTRLGLVESRIVGVGRGVHHVVELTAAGRIVLAGLRLSGQSPVNARAEGLVSGDVEVLVGRRDVEELLGDAWGFVRWRFLRGQVDEEAYWQRRAWLKQVAKRVGVELEADERLKSRGERRRG